MAHLQQILAAVVDEYMRDRPHMMPSDLRIVETGTIRGDQERDQVGDGYSTEYFAMLEPSLFYSFDLDTRIAARVLEKRGLDKFVTLCQEHSIDGLARLLRTARSGFSYDIAFLDSDNNEQLVFHEFLMAKELVKVHGLIIVDDCYLHDGHDPAAMKGRAILPWLVENGWKYRKFDREGWNDYKTGVLVIDRP